MTLTGKTQRAIRYTLAVISVMVVCLLVYAKDYIPAIALSIFSIVFYKICKSTEEE